VRFGSQLAASFNVLNDTLITAVVDSGATGAVIVSGSNGADTLAGFTYIPPVVTVPPPASVAPVITGFSPTNAHTGDTVKILGAHLDSVNSVSFGGTAARSFTILTDSTMIAIVGSGSTGGVVAGSHAGNDTLSGFTFDTTATTPVTPPDTTTSTASAFFLALFTGSVVANQPILQWKTQNEQHVYYYGVEQGTDTLHWNTIGLVSALEQDSASYIFADTGRSGLNFYRLSIVNSTGDSLYSPIIALQLAGIPQNLTIYPNPVVTGYFTVNVPVITSPSQFQMVDMAGNIVQLVEVAQGIYQVRIQVTGITKGVYKIIWRNGNQATYQNILIL
jgi:hypothetical protein